jgi:hypothetical protein
MVHTFKNSEKKEKKQQQSENKEYVFSNTVRSFSVDKEFSSSQESIQESKSLVDLHDFFGDKIKKFADLYKIFETLSLTVPLTDDDKRKIYEKKDELKISGNINDAILYADKNANPHLFFLKQTKTFAQQYKTTLLYSFIEKNKESKIEDKKIIEKLHAYDPSLVSEYEAQRDLAKRNTDEREVEIKALFQSTEIEDCLRSHDFSHQKIEDNLLSSLKKASTLDESEPSSFVAQMDSFYQLHENLSLLLDSAQKSTSPEEKNKNVFEFFSKKLRETPSFKDVNNEEMQDEILEQCQKYLEEKREETGSKTYDLMFLSNTLKDLPSFIETMKDSAENSISEKENLNQSIETKVSKHDIEELKKEYESIQSLYKKNADSLFDQKSKEEFQKQLLEIGQHIEKIKENDEKTELFDTLKKEVEILKGEILESLIKKEEGSAGGLTIEWYSLGQIRDVVKNIWDMFMKSRDEANKGKTLLLSQKIKESLPQVLSGIVDKQWLEAQKLKGNAELKGWQGEVASGFALDKLLPNELSEKFTEFEYKKPKDDIEQYRQILYYLSLIGEMSKHGIVPFADPKFWNDLSVLTGIDISQNIEVMKKDEATRNRILEKMYNALDDPGAYQKLKDENSTNFSSTVDKNEAEAKEKMADQTHLKYLADSLDLQTKKMGESGHLNEFGQVDINNPKFLAYQDKNLDPELYTRLVLRMMEEEENTLEEQLFYFTRGIATGLIDKKEITYLVEKKGLHKQIAQLQKFVVSKGRIEKILELDKKLTGSDNEKVPPFDSKKVSSDQNLKQRFIIGDKQIVHTVINGDSDLLAWAKGRTEKFDVEKIGNDQGHSTIVSAAPSEVWRKYFRDEDRDYRKDINRGRRERNMLTSFTTALANVNPESTVGFDFLVNAVEGGTFFMAQKSDSGAQFLNEVPKVSQILGNKTTAKEHIAVFLNFFMAFLDGVIEADQPSSKYKAEEFKKLFLPQFASKDKKERDKLMKQSYLKISNLIRSNKEIFVSLVKQWQAKEAIPSYKNRGKIDNGVNKLTTKLPEYLKYQSPVKNIQKETRNAIKILETA